LNLLLKLNEFIYIILVIVWAYVSLLHVSRSEIDEVIKKIIKSLMFRFTKLG
jgi:hypothetical protein